MTHVSRRAVALLLFSLLAAARAHASCGSSSCPLDLHALEGIETGKFSLDLSLQYIDQDRPRIGSRGAAVGALPSDHDEIRTINRLTALQLGYTVSSRFQVVATLPYVSRSHEHIESATRELEQWNFHDAGDAVLQGRYRVFIADTPAHSSLWVTAGAKFATGTRHETGSSGEDAEVTITPGTGSTDAIVGLTWQSGVLRQTSLGGSMGSTTLIPLFVSTTFRRNGRGTHEYRRGSELQVNAGTEYPLTERIHLLGQLNARSTAKDDVGETEEDRDFTGGRYLFVSPGVRFIASHGFSAYALVQLPVYQHVNGLQLTSRANYVVGVHRSF